MSASLKAGLIGAAVAVVLSVLGLIPCVGCVSSLLLLVVYAGVGVLAAKWMEGARDAGEAAGAGAVAGLIAGLGAGITGVASSAIRLAVGGGQAALARQLRQLPPEILEMWRDMGFDPRMMARPGWTIGSSVLCCGAGLVLAAALGAVAGAITVALKKKEPTV